MSSVIAQWEGFRDFIQMLFPPQHSGCIFLFQYIVLKAKEILLTIEAYNLKGDVSKVDIDKKTNTTSNLMINMGRDNQEQ